MVLGSVMMLSPALTSRRAFLCVPPPPMQTSAVAPVVGGDPGGHVADLPVDLHAVGLFPAGAEDRAADGQDSREGGLVEPQPAVLGEAEEAVAEADDLPAEFADGGLADGADGRVQPGAVAPRREDADALDQGAFHGSARRIPPEVPPHQWPFSRPGTCYLRRGSMSAVRRSDWKKT